MPMPMQRAIARLLVLGLLVGQAVAASADELRVMTSGAFTAAYLELKSQFEGASGHTLVTVTTTMGSGEASIPSRLRRGEAADVVIVEDAALRGLVNEHQVLADSVSPLVQSRIALAVQSGAAHPDISTVEAFTLALRNARSIAISASVSGTYLTNELFPRLGIAGAVAARVRRIEGERVGAVVARGDAEIGFQQVSELLPIAGIEIVGPLPDALQRTSIFSAGVTTRSPHATAARAFVAFLLSPGVRPALVRSGLEPVVAAGVP